MKAGSWRKVARVAAATTMKKPCNKGKANEGKSLSKQVLARDKAPQVEPIGAAAASQKKPKEKEICTICQEPLNKTKTECKELPCSHTFHRSCLVPWIRGHDTCPTCRTVAGERGMGVLSGVHFELVSDHASSNRSFSRRRRLTAFSACVNFWRI